MKLKPGILTGKALNDVYDYCRETQCALPAVNVIGSHSAVSAIVAARDSKAPIIVQLSHGGSQFFAGKAMDNKDQKACIAGGIAGAHFVRTMAEAYGVPVVLHTDHAAKKLLP